MKLSLMSRIKYWFVFMKNKMIFLSLKSSGLPQTVGTELVVADTRLKFVQSTVTGSCRCGGSSCQCCQTIRVLKEKKDGSKKLVIYSIWLKSDPQYAPWFSSDNKKKNKDFNQIETLIYWFIKKQFFFIFLSMKLLYISSYFK